MLTRRRLLKLGVAGALGYIATGGAVARAVVDALGNTVDLARPPQRIVAINPAMVESLFAIGAGPRVVAIGGAVKYPEEALRLPSVGGALGISVEAVLAMRPDLVVVAVGTEAAAKVHRPLVAMGVPVFLTSYSDFASILRYILALGEALGLREDAERVVAGMRERLDALAARLANEPIVKVFLETGAAGASSFQTVKDGHYASDAIRLVRGDNVFKRLSGPPQVTLEGLHAADPDWIVILSNDPSQTQEAVADRPGWRDLRAVRSGHVRVIPRGFMLIPGPRQADAIEILARAVHPGAFP